MMTPSPQPRYDRIVSLVLLVLLGLAVVFFIDVNPNNFRAVLGSDLPVITVSWLLIASLVIIISTGADVFIRSHPQMQMRGVPTIRFGRYELELAPTFWILPSLSIIGSFAFFRLFSTSLNALAFVLALGVAGALLLGSLIAQHYAFDRQADVAQRSRMALQIITYLIGFGLFSAISYARLRTLYSGPMIGGVGALLAIALLQWKPPRQGLVPLGLLVGLTLAEAHWALNYWAASFLLTGALLLVLFYIITGLLQHVIEGNLSRQVFWEYGMLGSLLLVAVVVATFR